MGSSVNLIALPCVSSSFVVTWGAAAAADNAAAAGEKQKTGKDAVIERAKTAIYLSFPRTNSKLSLLSGLPTARMCELASKDDLLSLEP
eukprot:IDg2856t1